MGFFRGPNIVTDGLKFAIDAGSERSYPRLTPAAVWYDYSGGLAAGRYTIENSVQPYTIRLNTSFASWVGYYRVAVPSAENYTIMFDYVADASSSLVLDNDGVDDNNWNATISVTTTVQTYNVTKAVTTTGNIDFYTRRNSGGNITISNFRFFKSDTVFDLAGANTGTLTNSVGFNSGNGGAFTFDGVDQYITVPNSTELNTPLGATFDIWIYPTAFGEILSRGTSDSGTTPDNPRVFVGSTGAIYFDWSRPGADTYVDSVAGVVTYNAWNNIVGVAIPGQQLRVYVNGVEPSYGTVSNTMPTPIQNTADPLIIGGVNWIPRYVTGKIANVKLYNKALSSTERSQNYNAQKSRYGL